MLIPLSRTTCVSVGGVTHSQEEKDRATEFHVYGTYETLHRTNHVGLRTFAIEQGLVDEACDKSVEIGRYALTSQGVNLARLEAVISNGFKSGNETSEQFDLAKKAWKFYRSSCYEALRKNVKRPSDGLTQMEFLESRLSPEMLDTVKRLFADRKGLVSISGHFVFPNDERNFYDSLNDSLCQEDLIYRLNVPAPLLREMVLGYYVGDLAEPYVSRVAHSKLAFILQSQAGRIMDSISRSVDMQITEERKKLSESLLHDFGGILCHLSAQYEKVSFSIAERGTACSRLHTQRPSVEVWQVELDHSMLRLDFSRETYLVEVADRVSISGIDLSASESLKGQARGGKRSGGKRGTCAVM